MSKGKLFAVCCVWIVILGVGAMAWKWWIAPIIPEPPPPPGPPGVSPSFFEHEITFALDSFSGYSVIRSEEFDEELAARKIRVDLNDDGANYLERIQRLEKREVQLAVFTIDALVKVSAKIGSDTPPATIVAIIDETRGADAIIGHESVVPDIGALNRADTKFVLTPDSPSEFLARVVMANFGLDRLGPDPFVEAKDAADVYRRFEMASPDAQQVYVLWEPYVSMALQKPGTRRVADSKMFSGKIVDVIVANRYYLGENESVVKDVVECYFRARHRHRDNMVELVQKDARKLHTPLTTEQAKKLVEGIWWKNTVENYAHMGLDQSNPLQHVERMVSNITRVLTDTGAIPRDPTGGKPNLLYYREILQGMKSRLFNPGPENVRQDELPALSDNEWKELMKVGTDPDPLEFARGTTTLTRASRFKLNEIAERLRTTRLYIMIRGHASTRGDQELNEAQARDRAEIAKGYLVEKGIGGNRIRAIGLESSGTPFVEFILGQPPY